MSTELLDRLAAQDVMVRYAACIDDRDWTAFRDCFTEDAEFSGFQRSPIRGPDAWVDFVRGALQPFQATQHLIGSPRVELRGDEAELRTALQAQHFHASPEGRIWTVWGTYRSLAVRDGERWRIRHHTLDVQSTRTSDPVPA